jgi:phosphate-selective porin OprO/OprP
VPSPPPAKVDKPAKRALAVTPGGYIQVDGRRLLTDPGTHEMTVRRLRFKLEGTAGPSFKFRTLIDFAGSKLLVKDAWVEYALRPELALRAGKDKSQFGIERLQSAAQLTFIERAFPTQLSPDRDLGLWVRGDLQGGFVHYAAGVVDGVANNAVLEGETDNRLEYNLHLLISPFAKRKELGDLGLGAATTFGHTTGTLATTGLTGIKSAGQTTIVKYPVDAANADAAARADGYRTRFAAHACYYGGPVGLLAEYVRDREPVRFNRADTLATNQAWQLAASVAITPGDHPTFKSLKPHEPFDPAHGRWGALELAGRYSELRIDPDGFTAGFSSAASSIRKARELTAGANWYFTEVLKLQLDYSVTTYTGGATEGDRPTEQVIATRIQAAI